MRSCWPQLRIRKQQLQTSAFHHLNANKENVKPTVVVQRKHSCAGCHLRVSSAEIIRFAKTVAHTRNMRDVCRSASGSHELFLFNKLYVCVCEYTFVCVWYLLTQPSGRSLRRLLSITHSAPPGVRASRWGGGGMCLSKTFTRSTGVTQSSVSL